MLNLKIFDKANAIISTANCFPYGFSARTNGVEEMSEEWLHHVMGMQPLEHGANTQN